MPLFYKTKIYIRIALRAFKKKFLRRGLLKREQSFVIDEYTKVWSNKPVSFLRGKKLRIYNVNGRRALYRSIDFRAFFIEYLSRAISSLKPSSVLELGSGMGVNIIILAVLHPEVKRWVGLELTVKGFEQSNAILANPPVAEIQYITRLPEQTIRKHLKKVSIEFVQGDMLKLPFADKSFDFVFSCWSFEQIPKNYPQAFGEANRVLKGHALFLEEFREAQQNIFQKLHLYNVDYFRASIWEVEKVGFKILRFEQMSVDKVFLSVGALLCSN